MKKIFVFCFLVLFSVWTNAQEKAGKKGPKKHKELKTELDSVSYALGVAIGSTIRNGGLSDMNQKLFSKALQQMLAEEEVWIDQEQGEQIITAYLQKLEAKKGEANLAAAKKFLEENRKKPGVVELPSGLQYKVITEGTGEKPLPGDKVTVHYHGTLINGKVFDSSIDRGEPVQLQVDRVIKGWTEALQLMPAGSKWILYIPPDLAYGNRSIPGSPIEANSLLIFEVELLSIEHQEDKPAFQDMFK